MIGLLRIQAFRAVLMAALPVVGWTVCPDHFARWSVVDGKIVRTLIPCGWRFARVGRAAPKSQLDQFLERR